MQININEKLSEEDKRRMWREQYPDDIRTLDFTRQCTEEQLTEWHKELLVKLLEIRKLKEQIKELNAAKSEEEKRKNELVSYLDGGGLWATEECYGFVENTVNEDGEKIKKMVYYAVDGTEVMSRPLKANERSQILIFRQNQDNQ